MSTASLLGVSVSLGQTGLVVSPIGLGLAALGRPGYITLGHSEDLAGHTDERSLEAATHEVLPRSGIVTPP
jgi:hypothetical protein